MIAHSLIYIWQSHISFMEMIIISMTMNQINRPINQTKQSSKKRKKKEKREKKKKKKKKSLDESIIDRPSISTFVVLIWIAKNLHFPKWRHFFSSSTQFFYTHKKKIVSTFIFFSYLLGTVLFRTFYIVNWLLLDTLLLYFFCTRGIIWRFYLFFHPR